MNVSKRWSTSFQIFANIRAHILDPMGALYNEPLLLLMEELREPRNYLSILRAIAQGRTRLNEIAQSAGVGDSPITARYLDTLQQMRIVRRTVPATESQPQKSKKGLYRVADAFLRFWFRFVHLHQGALSLGLADAVLAQRVRPTFDQFVSYAFAEAAAEYVARLARAGALPFLPERIGAWWDAREEIDIVAISDAEGAALVGECKWWAEPVGVGVLVDLQRKAQALATTGRHPHLHYALFSKSGFTADLTTVAAAQGVLLVSADEMLSLSLRPGSTYW